MPRDIEERVPVLLLKTRSAPVDTYEECLSLLDNGRYDPVFVPVLEHRFKQDALDQVRDHITSGDFINTNVAVPSRYGAVIFTSQRAVEAFTRIVESIQNTGRQSLDILLPENVPLYVVGPATARGVRAMNLLGPVVGEETGNGDALASFIIEHYNNLHQDAENPAILFLVGEKRRDVIPNSLQSEDLPSTRRAEVHELVIYETAEMRSFQADFSAIWRKNRDAGKKQQWVVVFSPQGCRAMLESLDLLDARTGKAKAKTTPRDVLIATIGPTTRDYLLDEFGFKADVCAERPSPEGIAKGIRSFNTGHG